MNHLNSNIVKNNEAKVGDIVFYMHREVECFAPLLRISDNGCLLDKQYAGAIGLHEVTFNKITKIVKCNRN